MKIDELDRLAKIGELAKELRSLIAGTAPASIPAPVAAMPHRKIKVTRNVAKRLHWTQKPENKAKVRRMARKGARTRRSNNNA